jgi:hypothetical protein
VTSASATAAVRPVAGTRTLVAAGAGVALVAAVVVAVVAAHHATPSEVSPVVPAGAWNDAWIGALVAGFAFYGAGALLAWSGSLRLSVAVGVAVAVQLAPLGAPLLLSKDAFLYWGEARVLVAHHANPYVSTPADYPRDPATPWVSTSWSAEPAPYGPAWEVAAAAPGATTSRRAAELAYRALAAAALLASIALVAWRTRRAAAVVLLGWSPVLALHFAGGGHGDALMMLLVLGAVAAGATAGGGVLWPIASAIKPFPPVLVPLELARRRLEMGRRWWLGLIGAILAIVVASTALFGTHWISSATTGAHQTSPLGGVHWLTEAGLTHRNAVIVGALVFVAVYAALLRWTWRSGRRTLSLAATALCLTSSLLRPWYALWPIALAAIEEDGLGAMAAIALSGYLLFGDAVQL